MNKGIFAFIGGVIVGAAAAIFLTPKTGREMREEVKKLIDNAEDIVKKNLENVIEEGKKQIDKIVSYANEHGKAITEKISSKKESKS